MPFDPVSYAMGAKSAGGGGGGGSGGRAFIVEMVWDESTSTFTMTAKAGVIFEAAKTGPVIFQQKTDGEVVSVYLLIYCYKDERYGFYISDSVILEFMANSADDYPTYHFD